MTIKKKLQFHLEFIQCIGYRHIINFLVNIQLAHFPSWHH